MLELFTEVEIFVYLEIDGKDVMKLRNNDILLLNIIGTDGDSGWNAIIQRCLYVFHKILYCLNQLYSL